MAAINFDAIPAELKERNQCVLWKQITRAGKLTKVPFQPNGIEGDSSDPSKWVSYAEAVEAYNNGGFDGIGFTFDVLDEYAGIDLDHCINEDGSILPKAKEILDKLDSYSEISPSGKGVKIFLKAKNPTHIKTKNGKFQQGFSLKTPGVLEIEIYYGYRFFTLTGNVLPDHSAKVEERNEELTEIFKEVFKGRNYFDEESEPIHSTSEDAGEPLSSDAAERLQKLFEAVPGFKEDLLTPAPVGKRSDAEFHFCVRLWEAGFSEAEIYAIMTSSPQTKWGERDDSYRWETIRKAVAKSKTHHRPQMKILPLKNDDICVGEVGICPVTGAVKKMVEIKTVKADGSVGSSKFLARISDCALHIYSETRAGDDTEFVFKGVGAIDKRTVRFTMPASSLSENRKFKAACINAFGAKNLFGKLDFETVQEISMYPRMVKRVEAPAWEGNVPLVPGINPAGDVEFKLSPMTPVKVFDGDIQVAKDLLRTLLKTHPYAPILVTGIMGAPAIARWRPDDRIGVGIWGLTGTVKTTMAKAVMSIYGSEYQSDRYLLKHGRGGSTVVAALEIMARAGILPQILDDVKAVDPRDHQNYVTIIHAVIEGSDKQRGKKDGGLRDSQIFKCTPIITGEVRPEEASTDARVCNLSWSKPNLDLLNEIESRANEMPIIGYHWLRFLAETDLNLNDGFNAARSQKELEFSRVGYTTNPGRLATIYTVLMATWNLLCESPLGEVFKEATEDFTHSLTRAIQEQGEIVNSDTEVIQVPGWR